MQDRVLSAPADPDFDRFYAFQAERPDEERWELIDGVYELNPSPIDYHQLIVKNILFRLEQFAIDTGDQWMVLPGLGIHLPFIKRTAPVPDVVVRPDGLTDTDYMDNPLVVFEVLSPSTRRKDLNFKRTYYSGLPSLLHYVAVEPKELFVRQFSRSSDWNERKLRKSNNVMTLPELGAKLPLADIYRRTGLLPVEAATKKSK